MADGYSNMRHSPRSQRMYKYTSVATTSPRSFLYYIVAAVGPADSHRPLAIAFRQGRSPNPGSKISTCTEERVNQVLADCTRLFDVFAEPSNRTALEAELSLAASWYQGPDCPAPDRVEVPDVPQPSPNFSWSDEAQEMPELPWPGGHREFPFISTCLRLALSHHGTRLGDVQEQPLGTVFRDNKLEYGMVVLDISDLNRIRYGIIGFAIQYIAEVDVTWRGDWDPVEDAPPEEEPVPRLEEPRRRTPLTAAKYMAKFRRFHMDKVSGERLSRRPVVGPAALEYIWPAGGGALSHDVPNSGAGPSNKRKRLDDLDQAINTLLQDAAVSERLEMSNIYQFMPHPEFQSRLLSRLRTTPLALSDSNASMQLLQLAYAGHSHLNWVPYGRLTYASVAVSLQSDQLRDAKALSLCIDHMDDSVDASLEVLSQLKSIDEINFLQAPTRENDERGSRLFAQICASSSGASLLRERKLFFTCAYSAPLQRRVWLPDIESRRTFDVPTYAPPLHAFPVQHMFVRQQFVASDDPKTFRPCYFSFGDALLDPERFAVGFLEYCRSVLTDSHLFSFACSSPTLPTYGNRYYGLRISPLSAENLAIPRRCTVTSTNSRVPSETHVECWPMVRDFEAGSWVVLVSHEWYVSPEVDRRQPRPALGYESEVPFIRYAFIRTLQHITINDETSISTALLEEMLGPNYVDVVGGLAEFLHETAGHDESSLVDQLLENTSRILASRWLTGLGPGMSHLSVLGEKEARAILRDFIENTTVVRGNLRLVMNAKPEERKWYPELLKGGQDQGLLQPVARVAVFKPLPDAEENRNPLGFETKQYEPNNDDNDDNDDDDDDDDDDDEL